MSKTLKIHTEKMSVHNNVCMSKIIYLPIKIGRHTCNIWELLNPVHNYSYWNTKNEIKKQNKTNHFSLDWETLSHLTWDSLRQWLIDKGFQLLTIVAKKSILDVGRGPGSHFKQ